MKTYRTRATLHHYNDFIMSAMASQITSLAIVYSTVYSGADQRKKSSASLAFVQGIHRWPVNSLHKGPVTRKMFPFMTSSWWASVVSFHQPFDCLFQSQQNNHERTTHDDVIKWKHFRVTGPLRGEFTGHRWIPLPKSSDAQLWYLSWSELE